eukprot:CAMPEP_0117652620 /NCGR_PEP_ID=MMETSP0804-20121206/2727_1 /TAXON_ID=1074897 /ORGANISM="Tetraselmis astigmatica, Strain CCMP880" /LENGTH=207 /DNA_ID=CAMNT_0005458685 /DNA_START=114 /DNA_END=737 /DNA_ORIENTATION=-
MADPQDEVAFHNRDPKTREEREAGKNKDAMQQRVGGFYVADCLANPVVPDERSAAYATEAERFDRDFARDEYERRVSAKINEEERLAKKRTEQYLKEQSRWDEIDGSFDAEMTRQYGCQTRPVHQNNSSLEPVNTITQRYAPTPAGQALREQDERIKWRAEVRRQNLWAKQQSQEHNIINGTPLKPVVSVPEEPTRKAYTLTAPWDK